VDYQPKVCKVIFIFHLFIPWRLCTLQSQYAMRGEKVTARLSIAAVLNTLDFTRQVHKWARFWELVYPLDFAWH